MKFIYFSVTLVYFALFFVHTNGFCLGMFCSYMPFMAKSCCSVVKKCCGHYQAWLSPLMTIDDNPDDYLQALTHEMIHNEFPGPAGFFENDVHRYPGVFSNINRYYKRHSRDSNRRLDNQGLDTKNSLNSLVANDAEKLNKLENLQLNNLNGLTFTDTKNKNMK